jgi:hypothetical protein
MTKKVTDKNGNEVKVPRTFMSPAYVEESGGEFILFRDVLVETDQPDGVGGFYREKFGKRIGPMMRLRPASEGERVDFITSRKDGSVIKLTRIDRPPEEENSSLQ